MTRDELLAQFEAAYAAWNAHDAAAIAALYTSDATVRDSADPDNPAVGSEAIRGRAEAILSAFSDAKLENDEGLTVEETAYWDVAIFLRQVGALPDQAATSSA